jgi:hypothetical protein
MGFLQADHSPTLGMKRRWKPISHHISRFHWFRQTDACRHAIKAAVENALTTFSGIDGYRK